MSEPSITSETNDSKISEKQDITSSDPKIMLRYLLPLLSSERVTQENFWLDIAKVLYNIYEGNEEGLKILIQFSNDKRTPEECESAYNIKLEHYNNLTIKTVVYYSKQDNPENYELYHQAWYKEALVKALSCDVNDVAQAIYKVYYLDYIYSPVRDDWYEYRSHYYRIGKENYSLKKKIIEHFIKIFEEMKLELNTKVSSEADEDIKSINDLIRKLKNDAYRSNVSKSCKELFRYEDFENFCDKNPYLTGLSNCVLEIFNKEKIIPRLGKPEDFITRFSKIIYPFDYTEDSDNVKAVHEWFDKITCRNKELKHYMFKRFASFLRGQNPEKLFDLWVGEVNNSEKWTLIKTLQYIFGSYAIDFPTSLLSETKNLNPELVQAMTARLSIISEPDDRAEMVAGLIKRTNGYYGYNYEKIFYRLLHDKDFSGITFKTIMTCNRIPDIANVDKGLIRCFFILPFLGIWSQDAPEDIEEQFKVGKFKIDEHFDEKIPELAKGLLWIMVKYYPYYVQEKLEFPSIVNEILEKHWEDNDPYLKFIEEKLEYVYKDEEKKMIDIDIFLSTTDLYPTFNKWFKEKYPNKNVPTLAQTKDDLKMTGRLGPQVKKGVWRGIKIKEE